MMASAFVALQGYGSDSSEDADSNIEDVNLHLKPLISDSSSVSQAISVYSAPAVAIKVVTCLVLTSVFRRSYMIFQLNYYLQNLLINQFCRID